MSNGAVVAIILVGIVIIESITMLGMACILRCGVNKFFNKLNEFSSNIFSDVKDSMTIKFSIGPFKFLIGPKK